MSKGRHQNKRGRMNNGVGTFSYSRGEFVPLLQILLFLGLVEWGDGRQ